MAVSIRLKRMGSKQRPFFRIVAADSKRAPQGRFIECVGTYDPRANGTRVRVDTPRIEELVRQGAHMTPAVVRLVSQAPEPEKQ